MLSGQVFLTRQAQSLSLGWLEVLVYPGSLAFSWEGVGISLTLSALLYGFQPLRMVLFALCYGQLLNRILKLVFQRQRPIPPEDVKRIFRTIILTDAHADGASFPSGDTMAGSVTGASLALAGCGTGWWFLGLYVGFGRVYFLAHHWLDVIAGYAEGCAVSLLAAKVIRMHESFDVRQLIGLLVASVGFGMAMKLTKRIYSGPAKSSHVLLLLVGLGLLFVAPTI
ncbi:Znhit2 [Symbiodinium natans]|uniref:Znhit2 protein n=1 Tax=Symbiodinium natans TaxID=878477 RepID=A0A812SXM7_9DINO|nr:Znhit2 [Symbiodinium natans]